MLVILVVIIIGSILLFHLADDNDYYFLMFASICSAVIASLFGIIMVICIATIYSNGLTADDKIAMYQKENSNIQKQTDILVKQYMFYEKMTYEDFKNVNSTTIISLFPELKSDVLVQEQIKVYVDNNKKIKELKEHKIDMKIAKWLLYFGK